MSGAIPFISREYDAAASPIEVSLAVAHDEITREYFEGAVGRFDGVRVSARIDLGAKAEDDHRHSSVVLEGDSSAYLGEGGGAGANGLKRLVQG
jgi:hypothetical protein